jgi:hypothetical protein
LLSSRVLFILCYSLSSGCLLGGSNIVVEMY